MIKTIKKKVFILTLSALSLVMMIMGIGLAQPTAKADVVAKSVSEITFTMVDAAQVRLDGKNGMRFAGKMSASDYEAIKKYGYSNIEYGVFIMPQSYLKKGALNKENTIDGKVFVYGSQYTEPTYNDNGVTKYRILHTETVATEQDGEYYAFGSVHNVLPQNLATAYTACAYIKATPTVGEVEYKFATAMQSPRSMLEVAFRAINSGDYDDTQNDEIVKQRAILDGYKTTYVNEICNGVEPTYSYTVNYMVDGNATPVKTEKVDNVAMNTAINYTPVAPEGYTLDSENAANVLSGHIYASNITLTVMVKALPKINGLKTDGELFYFSKDVTTATGYAAAYVEDDYYKVAMPESFTATEITALSIGGTDINDFTYADGVLKIAVSELSAIDNGLVKMILTADGVDYQADATVASSVIYNAADFRDVFGVDAENVYVVLDGDITWDATIYPSGWGRHLKGTFDGKGYAVKGLNTTAYFWQTTGDGAVIKNIAFLNVVYNNTNGLLIYRPGATTIDNVAVTFSTGSASGLISTLTGNLVISNTIVVCNDTSYGYFNDYDISKTITLTNTYCITPSTSAVKTLMPNGDGIYATAQATACKNPKELITKSNNINSFNNLWSIKANKDVYFGDELVVEYYEELAGEKNDGELFYFSKNVETVTGYIGAYVEDGYYKVDMPVSFTANEITTLSIGGTNIDEFTYEDGVLKIATSAVSGISNGVVGMNLLADGIKYQAKVTVASSVIYNSADFIAIVNNQASLGASGTGNSVYVILDGDITWDESAGSPTGWGYHLYGTFDGKGYAVKGFKTSAYIWQTMQSGSAIKNVAFLDVKYHGSNGLICYQAGAITIENVAITYSTADKYAAIGLVGQMTQNLTISNTIVVCNDYSYGYAGSYTSGKTLTLNNAYCITTKTAAIKTDGGDSVYTSAQATVCADLAALKTASENLKGFSDLWSIDNNGNLCFGDEIVISAE